MKNNNFSFGSLKHIKENWYGEDYLQDNPHPKALFKNREDTIDDILSGEPSLSSIVRNKCEKFIEENAIRVAGVCLALSTALVCGLSLMKSCTKGITSKDVKNTVNMVKEMPSAKIIK